MGLGGKDTEPLGTFCIQGVSGFLYLADDSPSSTLVTSSSSDLAGWMLGISAGWDQTGDWETEQESSGS